MGKLEKPVFHGAHALGQNLGIANLYFWNVGIGIRALEQNHTSITIGTTTTAQASIVCLPSQPNLEVEMF